MNQKTKEYWLTLINICARYINVPAYYDFVAEKHADAKSNDIIWSITVDEVVKALYWDLEWEAKEDGVQPILDTEVSLLIKSLPIREQKKLLGMR